METKLEEKSWLRWTSRLVSNEECDRTLDHLVRTGSYIDEYSPPTKNIFPLTCAMCDYREMCRMDRQGADYMSMVGVTHYVKGEEEATGQNIERTPSIDGDRGDA